MSKQCKQLFVIVSLLLVLGAIGITSALNATAHSSAQVKQSTPIMKMAWIPFMIKPYTLLRSGDARCSYAPACTTQA